MKCISLWQPWASLIVIGSKQIETRSWYTSYRGPLLIHAAKRRQVGESKDIACARQFEAAMHSLGEFEWHGPATGESSRFCEYLLNEIPRGCILGVANLVDCKPTSAFPWEHLEERRSVPGKPEWWWTERFLGNFAHGRFGWVFENPIMFETPIPYKGEQGLFNVHDVHIPEWFVGPR